MTMLDKAAFVYLSDLGTMPKMIIEAGPYRPYVTGRVFTGSPPYPIERFKDPDEEILEKMGFSILLGVLAQENFEKDDKGSMIVIYPKMKGDIVTLNIDEEYSYYSDKARKIFKVLDINLSEREDMLFGKDFEIKIASLVSNILFYI